MSFEVVGHFFVACFFDDRVDDGEKFWGSADISVHFHHSSQARRFRIVIQSSVGLRANPIISRGYPVSEGLEQQIDLVFGSPREVDRKGCVMDKIRVVLGPNLSGV